MHTQTHKEIGATKVKANQNYVFGYMRSSELLQQSLPLPLKFFHKYLIQIVFSTSRIIKAVFKINVQNID